MEEALVEMYLAGVSVRRVEDITEALWGTRVSPSTVSELNQKIYAQIESWRNRPIEGSHAYVFLVGLWLKRSWGGEVRNVSLLVAIGVNEEVFREVLAVAEGWKEGKASWTWFLRYLKERGLKGVRLFVSDKCLGLVESLGEFYLEALWQRCAVHFYRNVWTAVPTSKVKEIAAMLKAIHAQEDRAAARQKAEQVAVKLKERKLPDMPRRWCWPGLRRRCTTTRFQASTGGVCERTTRWRGCCVKYDEERGRWEHFPMASQR